MNVKRIINSLSFRLQSVMIFLSVVGVVFGIKSYLHIRDAFGTAASEPFYDDLMWQLVAAVAVNIGVAFIVFRIVTKPIRTLCEVMRVLTENRFDLDVPYIGQGNEIGSMARKVEIFKKNGIEKQRLECAQAESEKKRKEEEIQMMNQLAGAFESKVGGIVEDVSAAAGALRAMAQNLLATAEETTQQTVSAAAVSSQASGNVEAVSTEADGLSGSIQQISNKLGEASAISKIAVEEADHTNEKVRELAESVSKIGDIVHFIAEIAEQTNLLALNATIEAARAGSAGKGFAVVASEVKNLANQTSKATEDIANQINAVQSNTQAAVDVIGRITQTVSNINQVAADIAGAVDTQSRATTEIARNANEASAGTHEVNNSIVRVKGAASETGRLAENVLASSETLSKEAGLLREEITQFLASIRQ